MKITTFEELDALVNSIKSVGIVIFLIVFIASLLLLYFRYFRKRY